MTDAASRAPRGMDELAPSECLELLESVVVGRVGVTIDALPSVLPVNFVVWNGSILFATVPGTKLDAAASNAVVAFEADEYGTSDAPTGWSVLVRGIARVVTDRVELAEIERLPLDSWAFDGTANHYVCIEPTVMTGRRLRA
jgi:nitroimidazol reductase NimA-like FMN-containing flavoprotein (pyridoxamine 5'-phosphate oxidase superfamily)